MFRDSRLKTLRTSKWRRPGAGIKTIQDKILTNARKQVSIGQNRPDKLTKRLTKPHLIPDVVNMAVNNFIAKLSNFYLAG